MQVPVLVLNANFEPVNVCDMRRAINLLLAEKASLVVNGRGEIKTISTSFPRPSVIRLQKMITRPRRHLKPTRREIFRRDNYTCQYCGKKTAVLTIDHVIPRYRGGKHTWDNVVAACSSCNHRKGGRILSEANMRLLHSPGEPPSSAQYIFGRHLADNSDWEIFLSGW